MQTLTLNNIAPPRSATSRLTDGPTAAIDWLPAFDAETQATLARLGARSVSADRPIHIICYYKETAEVHQSMDAFDRDFNPPVIAICEDVPPPSAVSVLSAYFVGPSVGPGLTIGQHRASGAPFIIYRKTAREPRGKRYSHRIGAHIASALLGGEIEGVFCLFQDADTASNPQALAKMTQTAVDRRSDIVGSSMTCVNASPVSVIGSYTTMAEMLVVSERLIETLAFSRSRIVSGSYVLLRLSAYFEFAPALCRPTEGMTMFERIAYATEDTLLSQMMSGAGKRAHIVFDEVAWNLPQRFEELLKQRRRWMNGEVATFLISWPFIHRRLGPILFYLWTAFFVFRSMVLDPLGPALLAIFLYQQGYPIFLIPVATLYALKALVSIAMFRRNPDGLEWALAPIAHLYCMTNLFMLTASAYYLQHNWVAIGSVAALVVAQLAVILRGGFGRKLFFFIAYWVHCLYARGISTFLWDYALANLSDTTWGVRETATDRSREAASEAALSRGGARREVATHLAMMVVFQAVVPLSLSALVYASHAVFVTLASLHLIFAALSVTLFFARAVIRNNILELFVAEPIYEVKDRLVYSPAAARTGGVTAQQS